MAEKKFNLREKFRESENNSQQDNSYSNDDRPARNDREDENDSYDKYRSSNRSSKRDDEDQPYQSRESRRNEDESESYGKYRREYQESKKKSFEEDINEDPNKVPTEITRPEPIVVLFGPRTCGKTVALLRLAFYLKNTLNFDVEPDYEFRKGDSKYLEACDKFNDFIELPNAPTATGAINFLLLRVSDRYGRALAQLVEAPGEHYFNPDKPTAQYLPYFSKIVSLPNPKIYVFFLELDWLRPKDRANYADKIRNFLGRIRKSDGIILVCNKADKFPKYIYNSKPDLKLFEKDTRYQYAKIFDNLGSPSGGLSGLFGSAKYQYDLIAFSAGDFAYAYDGDSVFTHGPDLYPEMLWKTITRYLKGR